MEKRLKILYDSCVKELISIGIDLSNIGEIDIKLSKRANKRYGCCKHEEPDESSKSVYKKGFKRIIKYEKFNKHHIEISKWVMDLNEDIIKNTIIHEIIHCFPYCNNHGKEFKNYANIINKGLGYNVSRTGNKEADYKKSNIQYKEENNYKYKIECQNCMQIFYRKRYSKNFVKKYRCGKCGGSFKVYVIEQKKKYYTYMVRCKDNSIYSGFTVDLDKRIETHNSGKGAKYTRVRRPVELVYFEEFETKEEAMKREWEFKQYTHKQKEILINNKKRIT